MYNSSSILTDRNNYTRVTVKLDIPFDSDPDYAVLHVTFDEDDNGVYKGTSVLSIHLANEQVTEAFLTAMTAAIINYSNKDEGSDDGLSPADGTTLEGLPG